MATKHPPASPLTVRDGVAPSRVYLPKGQWLTLIDFLVERFPYTSPGTIRERLQRGEIVDSNGEVQVADAAYVPYRWLWYYREVPDEARVPFEIDILYRDDRILAIDKPHFLASIPGGRYLRETALTRLRHQLDLPQLSPVHRLDRETAGVMLFTVDPACRGQYQSLFQSREVSKTYEAVAPLRNDLCFPLERRTRLQPRSSHFTMHEVEGDPNAHTVIDLIRSFGTHGLYRLLPITGRKHQLRAHLSALGIPVCNDLFYPDLQPSSSFDDYSRPLQLLARRLEFIDPFTQVRRVFESCRQLQMVQPDVSRSGT